MFRDTMTIPMDKFSNWLNEEMEKRAWSQSDLARASGLTRQVISYYLVGVSKSPNPDALRAIATALKVNPISVFRKAGLLPAGPENEIQFEDWEYLLKQLPPEEQEEMRQLALLKIEKRKKAEAAAQAAQRKLKHSTR